MSTSAIDFYEPNFCTDADKPIQLVLESDLMLQITSITAIGLLLYYMPYIIRLQVDGFYNTGKVLFSPEREQKIHCALASLLARSILLGSSITILLSTMIATYLLVTKIET